MDKKIIGVIFGATLLFLIGGIYFISGQDNSAQVQEDKNVKAYISETTFDWGEIGINNGKAEKTFDIKNEGTGMLKLSNISTSCMCTTAQLILDGKASPAFGMHQKSSYVMEVPPQKTAKLKVVFDPLYHGPDGVGAITRQIKVETNDPGNPELDFMLTATVRK